MSTAPPVKKGGKKGRTGTPNAEGQQNGNIDILNKTGQEAKGLLLREWDYKLALLIVTLLAFATRFYGIGHPDQVVFDEVHFGKVRASDNSNKVG